MEPFRFISQPLVTGVSERQIILADIWEFKLNALHSEPCIRHAVIGKAYGFGRQIVGSIVQKR